MSIYLKQLALGPMQNFVYVLGDPATHEAAVVDPAWNVPAILEELKESGYRLTHVFLSHGHFDHVNGAEEIVDKTGATVCGYASEMEKFIPEGMGGLVIPRSSFKNTNVGDSVRLGQLDVQFIHTPGHTPGAQCPYIKDKNGVGGILFTGDILFVGTIGRCDFPYSNPQDLFRSLEKIKKLPDETVFYPGHDYGATPSNTLGQEKKTNPFLMCRSFEQFLQMVNR